MAVRRETLSVVTPLVASRVAISVLSINSVLGVRYVWQKLATRLPYLDGFKLKITRKNVMNDFKGLVDMRR